MSTVFGREISKDMEVDRKNRNGINVENGRVTHIICMMGPSTPYPNVVHEDHMLYCHSPNAIENSCMRACASEDACFEVFVVDFVTGKQHFWGNAFTTRETDVVVHRGKNVQRFRLQRCRTTTDPSNVRPKRVVSVQTEYMQTQFKSLNEHRFARLLDYLKLKWYYELLSVHWRDRIKSYTPDFWIPAIQLYVEVKGKEPSDDEIAKASYLCEFTQQDVAILYGDFRTRSSTIGVLFMWDDGVTITTDCRLTINSDKLTVGPDIAVPHNRIDAAFQHVRENDL